MNVGENGTINILTKRKMSNKITQCFCRPYSSLSEGELANNCCEMCYLPITPPCTPPDAPPHTRVVNMPKNERLEDFKAFRLDINVEPDPIEPLKAITPDHYKAGKGDVIEFCQVHGLNFSRGNIIKYVTRAGKKADELEDLLKAKEYLQREINHLTKK